MVFITCALLGGLGNQMFQIATAYAMARKFNVPFRISLENTEGRLQGNPPSKYVDTVFRGLRFEATLPASTKVEHFGFLYKNIDTEVCRLLEAGKAVMLRGYFQSELYFADFKDEIRRMFCLDELRAEIGAQLDIGDNSCFVGVRRGDYLKLAKIHMPCAMNYYLRALEEVCADTYYIASDDIEWCKQNFVGPQFKFFEGKFAQDDVVQFAAMTLFRKFVIANSTFNWWGSYLADKDSLVVAPDCWINIDGREGLKFESYYSIYRDSMVVIPR